MGKITHKDMTKSKVRLENARSPEQRERMERLAKDIGCFFCDKNYLKVGASPAIRNGTHWYIKKNDYPYEGSVHHYLIASKRHLNDITKIDPENWKELHQMFRWLKRRLKTRGEAVFVRSGDMRYTGGTLDHIHFHFLSGGPKKKDGKMEDNIIAILGHKKR